MDLYPRARRALLTAYADTDAAIQAINVVDVDHYLLKPWSPPEEKLYPVVDTLLELWLATGEAAVLETKVVGHRWSVPSFEVRDFLARNAVPYRWYGADDAEGQRLLAACDAGEHDVPLVVTPEGAVLRCPGLAELASARGPVDGARRRLLRRPHRGRRPRRPRGRGVRRVRGAADGPRRAGGDRWAGRAELADRELPRLPRRRLGRAAHRPGTPAGGEVRCRDAHHPDRRRDRGRRTAPRRPVRRRQRDRRPHGHPRDRGLLPSARRGRRGRARRARRVLRLDGDRGGAVRWSSTWSSSVARTPRGRPRSSSPGTPPRSRLVVRGPTSSARCRSTSSTRSAATDTIDVRTCTRVVACEGDEHLEAVVLADESADSRTRVETGHAFVFIGAAPHDRVATGGARAGRRGVRPHRPGPPCGRPATVRLGRRPRPVPARVERARCVRRRATCGRSPSSGSPPRSARAPSP